MPEVVAVAVVVVVGVEVDEVGKVVPEPPLAAVAAAYAPLVEA